MSRIPDYATADPSGAEQRLAQWPKMNVTRMIAHAGRIFDAFQTYGIGLLTKTRLDPVLREVAILRVGALSGSAYEVHHHRRLSRQIGMSEAKIEAAVSGAPGTALTALETAVLRFTEEVVLNVRASDGALAALRGPLSDEELMELTLIIGNYMAVARVLETFGVEIEDAAAPGQFNLGSGTR